MKSEIKQRWIEALRSGDYEQGKEYLNNHNRFCCLGVLCDLYSQDCNVDWETDPHKITTLKTLFNEQDYLPMPVTLWAGIVPKDKENISTDIETSKGNLSWLNDSGATFGDIANIIEEEIPND